MNKDNIGSNKPDKSNTQSIRYNEDGSFDSDPLDLLRRKTAKGNNRPTQGTKDIIDALKSRPDKRDSL